MVRYVSPVVANLASFKSFAGVDLHKDTIPGVGLINAVAVARHMLMWMWSMARRNQPFTRKAA
ncbi:MAG: hypothetical protein IT446_13185 [Phycisphaerales bacterium]|nr:hypothetical protein [Phycisphaerales bacterium]